MKKRYQGAKIYQSGTIFLTKKIRRKQFKTYEQHTKAGKTLLQENGRYWQSGTGEDHEDTIKHATGRCNSGLNCSKSR